jgi:hypothetical protein
MKNKSIMTIALIAIIVAAGFGGYTLGNQNDAKNTNTSVTTEQQ